MARIVTLPERKAAEAARRTAAVETLIPVLTDYARAHGGRFLLFGSAARRQMRWNSDVDLLVDFPEDKASAAWDFAEHACCDRDLDPDILSFQGCKPEFLEHIRPDLRVLA